MWRCNSAYKMVLAEDARPGVHRDRRVRQIRPARELGDLFQRGRAFAFLGAQLHARDQAAQVLIACAVFAQQRIALAVGAGDFRADMRAHAGFFRRHVKARRAVDAVAVEQAMAGMPRSRAGGHQIFGHGCAFEEAEGGAGV